jgi:hypothetical protein
VRATLGRESAPPASAWLRSAACARALSLPICLGLLAAACGGGSAGPPPPKADFALVITPEATFAVTGNTTAPVVLSVAPQNGFSDSVTVTLQGVPQGVTVSPSSPFVLTAGQTRSLAFTVPAWHLSASRRSQSWQRAVHCHTARN